MLEGQVQAALQIIAQNGNSGILSLKVNWKQLCQKHLPKQPLVPAAIVEPETSIEEPHCIMFDQIDWHMTQRTALLTDGAAGPSGLDAVAWKRLCSSSG